jgi:curved DNA-binding protein CbpA
MERDLYDALGVSPEADAMQIEAAIEVDEVDARAQLNSGDPDAAAQARARLAVLHHARLTLLDPDARRAYDYRRAPPSIPYPIVTTPSAYGYPSAHQPPAPYGPGSVAATVAAMPGPVRTKLAAALFAFFLGPFGVHNFYLGRNGIATAQLLITVLTCGGGLVVTWPWAIVEGILILSDGMRDGDGKPLR